MHGDAFTMAKDYEDVNTQPGEKRRYEPLTGEEALHLHSGRTSSRCDVNLAETAALKNNESPTWLSTPLLPGSDDIWDESPKMRNILVFLGA
jgi:hypothetical protein